jgi:WD40 repeat protein
VDVDGAVRELFLRSGRSDDPNLSYAEERLARHADPGPLLSLYRRLLEAEGEPVVADRGDWMQLELQLCGFAAEREEGEGLYLRVRNRIFATVFEPQWVKEKMDGRLLAVALARWQEAGRRGEASSGMLLRTLEGHSAPVNSTAFSPDGKTLVTGSHDRTARLWDAGSGRLLLKLEGHSDAVGSVAFSPDGNTVLTASADGTAILHPAHHEDYYRFACQVLSTWDKLPNVSDKDLAEVKATCPRAP